MKELINEIGPHARISGTGVRILCHSRAPGRIHAGTYIVNRGTWRVNSTIYPPGPHSCHEEVRGCIPAIQLRALHAAFHSAKRGTTFNVEMTSHEAVLLIRQWQHGNLTPPAWFNETRRRGWLFKMSWLVALNPTALTVKTVDLTHARWGTQTRDIVDALISSSRIRHPERRAAEAAAQYLPLFLQLPT
jgi:hypothetical protein